MCSRLDSDLEKRTKVATTSVTQRQKAVQCAGERDGRCLGRKRLAHCCYTTAQETRFIMQPLDLIHCVLFLSKLQT